MTWWSPPPAPICHGRGRSSRSAGLETAKTRLGEGLDAEERLELVTDLLTRTLVATRDASRIAGTVVVTMDPAAAGLAQEHRAIGLVERAPGLNAALVAARSVAVARGASAIVVLPADLPAITALAVDCLVEAAVLAAARRRRAVVAIVPDRHGSGTNALLVSPPDAGRARVRPGQPGAAP